MAAESSRSSGSADSYIGSIISLTSKSEIRYEGVLFNINTEEASIGLRNVRSFGTEGRKKDGQQIPASDIVYEYIVFRGSDIKDLQVKSSPPVPTAPSVHNDPAIIQSHYATPPAFSSLPSASASSSAAATGSISDFNSQMSHPAVPRATYQNNIPLYQPGGMTPWNSSTPPTTNGSPSVPMYWQGYYGPSGALQLPQQSLVQPVQGLSMPPSVQLSSAQQPVQYSSLHSSSTPGAPNVSTAMELPPKMVQPVSSAVSMQPTMLPVHPSALIPDSMSVMPSKASTQVVPAVSLSSNLPLVSPAMPNVLDKSIVASLVPSQAKPISGDSMPLNSLSEQLSTLGATSSLPTLVTPGQFLQPGLTTSQPSQTAHKDVEVVHASSSVSLSQPPVLAAAAAPAAKPFSEVQAPLLPLPSASNLKINGVSSHTRYVNQGNRDRGRGNEFARPVVNFTEDFDFEAMNEKFKKEEVWGHLGKSKNNADDDLDSQYVDEVDVPKVDEKSVYKKDDFFDTLSCNALDRDYSRNGRNRFSEQMRLDTETFGDFPRNRGYRGGRGPGRGGRSHGGYYGRGYGYVGRGRGHNIYRAI